MFQNWFSKETQSFYIARPDSADRALIYMHPDRSIPRGTKLTVRSDECALFFREGQYVGRVDAGTVQLDTANIPFLGHLLIDRFTGANHFICELFFVSLNETIFHLPLDTLGQYRDRNSAHVVSILGGLSYTVRVADPGKLIIDMGGQASGSGAAVTEILNGRLRNQFKRIVGLRTQVLPALDVVSNVDAESIANELRQATELEFRQVGVDLVRLFDLALSLDQESLNLLRAFGRQEAELSIQAKGMKLATSEGFAEFNLIQGQRAALEGLGKGMGTGNAPMVLSGMGLGGNLTGGMAARPPARPAAPRTGGQILSGQPTFLIREPNGSFSGPYSPRQVALIAISKGQSLESMTIRGSGDPEDVQYTASAEPSIADEYRRRVPPAPSPLQQRAGGPGISGNQAFDMALEAAVKDGILSGAELEMLSNLAVALGLDTDTNAAKVRVFSALQGKNVRFEP